MSLQNIVSFNTNILQIIMFYIIFFSIYNPHCKQIKGHNSKTEKVLKYEIKLGLTFMVSELVCKFQMGT
jgi:hypothetical protein